MALISVCLVTGADGRWHLGIGDPNVTGWVTVVAYLLAAYFCFRARRACLFGAKQLAQVVPTEAANQRMLARFWLVVSIGMVLLGINKQLDLQTLLTEIVRDLAKQQGWYETRHRVQVYFVFAVAWLGLSAAGLIAFFMRKVLRRVLGPIVGVTLVAVFVVVRAASFHHVDALLYYTGPVRLNWVIELSAISVLAISAFRAAAPARGATG